MKTHPSEATTLTISCDYLTRGGRPIARLTLSDENAPIARRTAKPHLCENGLCHHLGGVGVNGWLFTDRPDEFFAKCAFFRLTNENVQIPGGNFLLSIASHVLDAIESVVSADCTPRAVPLSDGAVALIRSVTPQRIAAVS